MQGTCQTAITYFNTGYGIVTNQHNPIYRCNRMTNLDSEYIIVKNDHNKKASLLMRIIAYDIEGKVIGYKYRKVRVRIMTKEFFDKTYPEEKL